jgi:tetratricopeptide (TPR) repeat protein
LTLEAQAALYRSLLNERRVLVVLDNARDAEQVRPLLPGSPGCLVVVTSRSNLSGLIAAEGAQPVILDLLSDEQAREVLARRLGLEQLRAEPGAVEDIIASCAGLPLALAVVAARVASRPGFPLAALADDLRQARGSLDAFDSDDRATDVRGVFSWSYRTLSAPDARMFRLLGQHPGPRIGTAAAASLAGMRLREAAAALGSLAQAHLVDEQVPGRFGLHDLMRAYAAERLDADEGEPDRQAALHRMFDHYLHSAIAADRLLSPHRDREPLDAAQPGVTPESFGDERDALTWFTAEHPVLLALVQRAADAGFDIHACRLAWALTTFFDRRGHWHDSAAVQQTALRAARQLADVRAEAKAHRVLARALIQLDRHDDAHRHLQRALGLYGDLDDAAGSGRTHHTIAALLNRSADHDGALAHAQRALEMYTAAGRRKGQADALNAIGWFHAHLGGHKQALDYCERALRLYQEIGDREGEAYAWDSLGFAHRSLGDDRRAIACYKRAQRLWRTFGDRYFEATALAKLSSIHRATGDTDAAAAAWRAAMSILDEVGQPEADLIRAGLRVIGQDDPGQR